VSAIGRLSDSEIRTLVVHPAGPVDVRRDIHVFLGYLRERGIRRTVRGNLVPRADAARLAKLLSHAGEGAFVKERGAGLWCEHLSMLLRAMGLVFFDVEGSYRGYSSTARSFVDNDMGLREPAIGGYLDGTPRMKERSILDAHLGSTESEFFTPPILFPSLPCFDMNGSAIGPAGCMKLPAIRRSLLQILADLEPGVFYDLESFIEDVREKHPRLILASADGAKGWDRGDLYRNFREERPGSDGRLSNRDQLTTGTSNVFRRVEGRYLERFLRGIPWLLGFVALAERGPADRTGLDVAPPIGRLRGFSVTERLRRILRDDPALDVVRVTVLPTFEVLVEAPSYPETVLAGVASYGEPLSAEAPIHRFRICRERVVGTVAARPGSDPVADLAALAGTALPSNVATDVAAWTRRGASFTVFTDLGLVEILADDAAPVLAALRGCGIEGQTGPFVLVGDPAKAVDRLEKAEWAPLTVHHRESRFAASPGALGTPAKVPAPAAPAAEAAPRPEARVSIEDLAGIRVDHPDLRAALAAELPEVDPEGLLLLPASALPKARAALRRLARRFDIQ
jgi:hypothetical protein